METNVHLTGLLKSRSRDDTHWMELTERQRVEFYTKRVVGALPQGTHPRGVGAPWRETRLMTGEQVIGIELTASVTFFSHRSFVSAESDPVKSMKALFATVTDTLMCAVTPAN